MYETVRLIMKLVIFIFIWWPIVIVTLPLHLIVVLVICDTFHDFKETLRSIFLLDRY